MNREETLSVLAEWGQEPPRAVQVRGKTFYVRNLTTFEVDKRQSATSADWQKNIPLTLGITAALCDEQGNLIFDPNNQTDVDAIGKAPWVRMQKIIEAFNHMEESETGN